MAQNESQPSSWSLASLGTGGPLVFVVALLALLRVYAPPQSEPPKGETSKAPSGARSTRPASDSEDGRSSHCSTSCASTTQTFVPTNPPVSTSSWVIGITSRC